MLATVVAILNGVLGLVLVMCLAHLVWVHARAPGVYLYNPDATIRLLSTCSSARTIRPLSWLEVLGRRSVRLHLSANELFFLKADKAARIRLHYIGPVTDPDLILQANGTERRMRVGERCEWLVSPDHDLVIRTVAAVEPGTTVPLRTLA